MKVDKTLVSGSTAMLLLKLLSEKDMYGYENDRGPAEPVHRMYLN